ncbi:MAG: iron-containing alcohol dehydrogenase family protein [Acidimicrobiia bacterium]
METDPAPHYSYSPPGPRRILGGRGALAHLPLLTEELNVRRAVIVTSPSLLRQGSLLAALEGHLGDRHAGTFGEVEPHSPIEAVGRALELAQEVEADTVVSLGGGSSIDTAKGVVWYSNEDTDEAPLVHIAVPSTLSGAEYTTDTGITMNGGKRVHRHTRIIPQAVILDPEVAATAPLELLRMSLLNALAHCLEGLVSIGASPMTDASYIHAIRLLHTASSRLDEEAGLWTAQGGAALAALHQVPVGLAHALAHVVGGLFRTPHGATHAIVGPAVMRLNLPTVAAKQRAIAEAVGADLDGLDTEEAAWMAVSSVQAWARGLGIPPGLRDLGVPKDAIEVIAAEAPSDPCFETNPRELSREDVRTCVEWAWSGEIPRP